MPRLSQFIRENTDAIIVEWEAFARALPMGDAMDVTALRDHAKEMLGVIAQDLDMPQTERQQAEKAKGESDADEHQAPTAAQEHGAGRAERGFTVAQMVSEFRALRASVMRLWSKQQSNVAATDLEDVTRFNEAIDQAIAESITRFTHEVSQSKERFLAILGHDLRTPLGAIITSTGFILDTGELAEPYHTLVSRIAGSAQRMNQLVTDLLEFTRTRFSDTIPIVRADMDARRMVLDVVAEVAASNPSTTLQIETSGELRGHWDQERLTQALTNLVANAVQHGSDKWPIRVAAHGGVDEIIISVHNKGPIIRPEQLGLIFRPMTRGSADGSRDSGHLGLGLYIADKIVTAHGGSIDACSSEEEGTTFTVHLPR